MDRERESACKNMRDERRSSEAAKRRKLEAGIAQVALGQDAEARREAEQKLQANVDEARRIAGNAVAGVGGAAERPYRG